MSKTSNCAVFIVGMHRSGTSALTRCLSLAGADLPRDVMRAGHGNPTGHWEPLPIADLNDRILSALGIRWHTPFAPVRAAGGKLPLKHFEAEAHHAFHEQFGERSLIVFKEPRATILADFWLSILRKSKYAPRVVVMVRSPDEVARSLAERNGFSYNHGLLLWANYMVQAERLTRKCRRTIIFYDDLVLDPGAVLKNIKDDLKIDLPLVDDTKEEIAAFIRSDLRHYHATPGVHPEGFELVWKLAAWFRDLAGGHPGEYVSDQVARWLADLGTIFGPILSWNGAALEAAQGRVAHLAQTDERVTANPRITAVT